MCFKSIVKAQCNDEHYIEKPIAAFNRLALLDFCNVLAKTRWKEVISLPLSVSISLYHALTVV